MPKPQKHASLTSLKALTTLLHQRKQSYCRQLAAEGNYSAHGELRTYQTLKTIFENLTEDQYQELLKPTTVSA